MDIARYRAGAGQWRARPKGERGRERGKPRGWGPGRRGGGGEGGGGTFSAADIAVEDADERHHGELGGKVQAGADAGDKRKEVGSTGLTKHGGEGDATDVSTAGVQFGCPV